MTLLQRLNEGDRFARTNGMQLTEVREGYARAEMTVEEKHLNGADVCQGGAIFTLADLAFAAVSNCRGILTLGIGNTIDYISSARLGDHLVAEAVESVNHPKLPPCVISVKNQDGVLIAMVTGRSYRKKQNFEFDGLQP